jgi:hypothetical protein
LVDVAGNPRVRITIVEDVTDGTKIVRTNIIAATMRKILDRPGETRSEDPYLENFNLPTPPLMSRGRSHRRRVCRRSIIVDDEIFIDLRPKEDEYLKP